MNNPEDISKGMTPNLPLWSYQLQQNSKLAVKTRKDLEVHLITRALKDEGFKQELLANPKAVVEKELETKLPDNMEYNVLEETETTLYIVLPSNPYEGMAEPQLQELLGLTLEDVARWVLEQQINVVLEETSSVMVITRAWKNQAFKQELLNNPKATLANELEITIPNSLAIQVMSESPDTLYLVLPRDFQRFAWHWHLSDTELEAVAHAVNPDLLVVGSPGGYSATYSCQNSTKVMICPM
jgi:hypothetical protein